MKLVIKDNGKKVQEYDYSKSTDAVETVRDMKNILEYIEKNKLAWTIEITN